MHMKFENFMFLTQFDKFLKFNFNFVLKSYSQLNTLTTFYYKIDFIYNHKFNKIPIEKF